MYHSSADYRSSRAFALMEMVLVVVALLLVTALLVPTLYHRRMHARMQQWERHMCEEREQPGMVLQWMMVSGVDTTIVRNYAQGHGVSGYEMGSHNGRLTGKLSWGRGRWPGKRSISFSEGAVQTGHLQLVNPGDPGFTIVLWIWPEATRQQTLLAWRDPQQIAIAVGLDPLNCLTLQLGHESWSTSLQVIANAWNLIAIRQVATGIEAWRIGGSTTLHEQVTSHTVPPATGETTLLLGAAAASGPDSLPFKGRIDELVIFTRALAVVELEAWFRHGCP